MEIRFYYRNGTLKNKIELSNENLRKTAGMLSKVILKDERIVVGYSDPLRLEGDDSEYDDEVHDYIYLWTFNNLDEETYRYEIKDGINLEKINICDIKDIYSILYSGPRWGGSLTNKFFIDK